jgi:hypothetical protein
MAFAIKAELCDPRAKTFAFTAQKTMYGGKHIAEGDTVFLFASENEGGKASSRVALSFPPKLARSSFTIPIQCRAWNPNVVLETRASWRLLCG